MFGLVINTDNKFVVAIRDVVAPQEIVIEAGDVGMIKSEAQDHASIFFVRQWQQVELPMTDFTVIDVHATGDAYPQKICNVCHKLKATDEFERNQNAKGDRSVRRPSCQDCRRKINGMKVSRVDRAIWLQSQPANEPFECPICGKRTIVGVTSKVVLEHDHRTGKPGGWICDSCNTGLGRFKDDVVILKKAIEFLEKNY